MQAAAVVESTFTQRPTLMLIEGGAPFRAALGDCVGELRARALKLTKRRDAAEDLVQDTIERALRFEQHFCKGTNLRAWLYTILYSVFVTGCRRAKRERHHAGLFANDPCAWTTPEPASASQHLSSALVSAIDALNPAFRDALLLVDIADLPYRDAASELGIPVGTVMSRLNRARRALRSQLQGNAQLEAAC